MARMLARLCLLLAGILPVASHAAAPQLQVLDSFVMDNYEGLTHVSGKQYLMVSDDGGGDWQRTVLTLFTLD